MELHETDNAPQADTTMKVSKSDSLGAVLSTDSLGRTWATDSLGHTYVADSLGHPIADSLFAPLGILEGEALEVKSPPRWHEGTMEEVFGREAILIPERTHEGQSRPSFSSDGLFQGFVLLLAALYGMLLYYNMGDIRALFERIARNSAGSKHVFDEYRGSSFPQFMNTSGIIGLFFLGLLAVKYSDVVLPTPLSDHLPLMAAMPLSVAITVVFCGVLILQWLLLQTIGLVTLSGKFIGQLLQLRQLYFTLANIIISPTLLLFALCPAGEGEIWFFLIVIELAISLLLYLREALNLFLSKKVSILHWFLYLCGVEIFPLSLLWLIVTR